MSASGPPQEPKLLPAATMEDQDYALEEDMEPIVLGTPPFSSPDPATDAKKMLPLEDGTSAATAVDEADKQRRIESLGEAGYSKLSIEELQAMAEERDLNVARSDGKEGKARKTDYVDALMLDDTADLKATDFKQAIENAADQDSLDNVVEAYEASGRSYSSVDEAIDKKQEEFDANNT